MSTTAAGGRKFSILLVCNSYPPVLGGSEIEAQRVCRALLARGHRVHVLCAGGPPMPTHGDWIDPVGVPVEILTHRSRGRVKDLVFAFRVAWKIWRRREGTDIVYFLMQGLHVAAGLPASRFAGIPAVMKISGDGIVSRMRHSRAGRLELRCLRKWQIPVMLLNEAMFQEAAAAGLARRQLVWMPNPVEIDEFRPAAPGDALAERARLQLRVTGSLAIYVGRLSGEKGLQPLLRGFALAARTMPESTLILLGDGPLRGELEALSTQLGLRPGQVRFTGRLPPTDVPAWLRASDVFALTSPNEGFPCSLLEAMCCGLPSIASDIPANRQLVEEGTHGLLVRWDDEQAIARAFLRLFGDPELRRQLSGAARRLVVEKYATAHVIERYEALFGTTAP
jgi:glycosyltransferase involved in cell wall biosynthesis